MTKTSASNTKSFTLSEPPGRMKHLSHGFRTNGQTFWKREDVGSICPEKGRAIPLVTSVVKSKPICKTNVHITNTLTNLLYKSNSYLITHAAAPLAASHRAFVCSLRSVLYSKIALDFSTSLAIMLIVASSRSARIRCSIRSNAAFRVWVCWRAGKARSSAVKRVSSAALALFSACIWSLVLIDPSGNMCASRWPSGVPRNSTVIDLRSSNKSVCGTCATYPLQNGR